MKVVSVLLIILGFIGIICGFLAYGDIGIACLIGGTAALMSGIGFTLVGKKFKEFEE